MWRLTDEQRALREEIRAVVREEIQPRVREIDENCEYPRDLYAVMAEHDLLGLSFPREYGGRCDSDVSWCAYVEELAKVSGTVSLMAAYVKLVSLPLLLAGSEEQKQRVLPGCCRARRWARSRCRSRTSARTPARSRRARSATATRGCSTAAKRFIGNAGLSDVYVVFARTGDAGRQGRQRVPRRRARRRRVLRAAAHDGHAGLAARRAALRGRRGAGREPDRPRGRRLPDRDGDVRPLAADGRRPGGRARAGRDRPRRRLRVAPPRVRQAAARPTRACSSSSPTWRPTSPPRGR